MHSFLQPRSNSHIDRAVGPSRLPILAENLPAQEERVDNWVTMGDQNALLPGGNQGQPPSNTKPRAKRKINFTDEGGNSDIGAASNRNSEGQTSSGIIAPNVNVEPPAKRKPTFSDLDEDHNSSTTLAPSIADHNQSHVSTECLEDEDDATAADFRIVRREGGLEPFPSIENYIATTESGGESFFFF